MPAEILIERLERVKATGPDRWQARCPAHDDRGPSLSIRETADGKTLIHCFAGCSVYEVVAAVGLDLAALFPPREHHGNAERRPFSARDAMRAVSFEALVVAAAGAAILAGEPLGPADRERLELAVNRLQAAEDSVMPSMTGARHA